jgi:D-alanine-D-alanine ligase
VPATAKLPVRRRQKTLKLAVLMGGVSSEREVSLRSGRAVATALAARGHETIGIDVSGEGPDALAAIPRDADGVFIALHGRFGEDGEAQRRLAALGVPYTGSGPAASARAFDKAWTKAILRGQGIQVARDVLIEFPFKARDVRAAIRRAPGPRLVVKPTKEGSSVGVSICKTLAEAAKAAWRSRGFQQPLLVEEFIAGRELTVAVLDDEALPPIEVVPALAFYDYKAKYDPTSGTRYRVSPDDIAPEILERARAAAVASHRALGCEGCTRVDLRIDEKGEIFVLEVNTIPGMTATSLVPKAAAAAGISFEELCERLVRRAISRAKNGERSE